MNCTHTWLPCNESCGKLGVQACVGHCKVYELYTGNILKEFDSICEPIHCFTHCETTARVSGKVHKFHLYNKRRYPFCFSQCLIN